MRRHRGKNGSPVLFPAGGRRSDPNQSVQRVKVGMIGLAVVILLIGLASAIIGSATRERAIAAAGSPPTALASNAMAGNQTVASPLAELGVAPMSGNTATVP